MASDSSEPARKRQRAENGALSSSLPPRPPQPPQQQHRERHQQQQTNSRRSRDGGDYDERSHDNGNDELPQPFDAKKLQAAKKRQRSTSPGGSGGGEGSSSGPPARKLKRPGQRARISEAEREQIRQRALERERVAVAAENGGGSGGGGGFSGEAGFIGGRNAINDVVRAHYNAVPERGRDWRKTDSRIKGLRAFNNWVKSCVIQKFAPDEDHAPGARERGLSSGNELLVLDIGCGKGGDLGKWHQSPQPIALYVGLDPAEVSVDQARERYRNIGGGGGGGGGRGGRGGGRGGRGGGRHHPPPFDARFQVKDCFGESIGDVDIVRQVGFSDLPAGGGGVSGSRGFDVVSMMFCMHYAFETEAKARQMLRNVAGALKKGGRFIGCIPNSDVIGTRVEEFNRGVAERRRVREEKRRAAAAAAAAASAAKEGDDAKEDGEIGEEEGEGEGEKKNRQEHASEKTEGKAEGNEKNQGKEENEEDEEKEVTAEWGNDIYRVRFPGPTPADGIFRPPFGWKYSFFLHEAVEEVPEYVVPWEAFRALAEDYNLELQFHRPFADVWAAERDDRELGPLSERMGVRGRNGGPLLVSPEEMEAASFYVAFCFYKV